MTRRFSAFEILTDPSGFTPRPIRPSTECASSSQCQRSEDHQRTAEVRHPSPTVPVFFTPSAFALDQTDESHRKDRSAPICSTPVETSALSLGGARRDRTDDLMLAKHALSQLSYGPVSRPAGTQRPIVVGLGGLEPPTSRLSSARSNQLSYKPGRKKKSTPAHGLSKPTEARGFHILRLRKRDEGGAIPQNAA